MNDKLDPVTLEVIRNGFPAIANEMAADLQRIGYAPHDVGDARFRKGTGCGHCQYTGYKGRVGIFELLILDERVRNAIIDHKPSHEIRQISIESTGLITLLEEDEMNLDFGNVGAKVVMNALSACGKAGIAYRMVNTTTYPGWGHWVSRGATTLWETWDGRLSRNHVMFGDVCAWMYKNLAGLSPDEDQPGFKRFTVHPLFPGDLDRVETEYHTLYGTIAVKWWREKEKLRMDITVPINTMAQVWLPAYRREEVLENGEPLQEKTYLRMIERTEDGIVVALEGGEYYFTIDRKEKEGLSP